MKLNLTRADKKLIGEFSDIYQNGDESSDIIKLKKYLSRKNNQSK